MLLPRLFAAGPAPVDLRSTAHFVILSGAGITSTGGGIINGDVGASPIAGSAIGVTCPQVNGLIYSVDASGPPCAVIDAGLLTTAKGDLTAAYNDAAGRTPTPTGPNLNPGLIPGSGNIGGMNLAPGLYKFTVTALISGADVTLTGGADDVWIFQCDQDLQLASGISVILAGGAQARNIFWKVGSSAVLGTFSSFKGTILADQSITMNTSSTIEGRALAFSAGVVFNGTSATVASAAEIGVEQPVGTNLVDGISTNNFGLVNTGTNASHTFTITNSGPVNLTGLLLTIDGADAAMFSVTTNPAVSIGPNGRTTFTVRFTPASPGVKTAALHIASNDSDENPFDITITGTGITTAPEIAVQQPAGTDLVDGVGSKDFGSVIVGANTSLIFTITNSGTASLTGLGITIDGVSAAQFTVTANPVAPVGPNGSTTFTVRFAPTSAGVKTAALHIASNDGDENPFDITITGTGTLAPVPEIAVQQPAGTDLVDGVGSKDFGSVIVGANTNFIFTITNSGTASLTGLGITIDGVSAAQFTVTANPVAPVGPNGSTTFTVRFAPTSAGVKTAALHIASNDGDENPFDITFTGTGLDGGFVVTTNVVVSSASPITLNPQTGLFEQTVRLANNGLTSIDGIRLRILNLPAEVQVYNASGSTNGTPFVQYDLPLAAGATVDLLIEYHRANRQTIPQPGFVVEVAPRNFVTETGPLIAVDRSVQLVSGRFLIEFSATPGRRYAVQYSSDVQTWKTANPVVTAPANRVQWYDDGPPKTESRPETIGSRFYRVMILP